MSMKILEKRLLDHSEAIDCLTLSLDRILDATKIIENSLRKGGKLLICGNGGSASDAQHMAAELVGRFVLERKGLPAIALNTDTSIITAVANDYSYDDIYSRQLESLFKKDDVLLVISSSGNSKNIINVLNKAKEIGCTSISLLGKDGGECKNLTNFNITIKSFNTAAIQEMHIIIIHMICDLIDQSNLKKLIN